MYKIVTRLDVEIAKDAKELAKSRHISFNTLIILAIEREIMESKFLSNHN
jgi:predicted HicB family RNase H-like nuclease